MPVHTVTYTAAYTPAQFPAGTTLNTVQATLLSTGPAIGPVSGNSGGVFVFTSVPDGSYTLSVQATDTQGANLGTAYTVPVVVSDPPVTINIPSGGTVTIS